MRPSTLVLPLACLTAWTTAQTYDPANSTIFQLSSDPDFAFNLEEKMAQAMGEGAATAEVLRIATQIVPTEFESWYSAFYSSGEKIHAVADSVDPDIDPVGARQAYFRAATYYFSSSFYLVGNASDPRLYSTWKQGKADFAKAIDLLRPAPGISVTLQAKNSSIGPFEIPGYFFPVSPCGGKRPTIIVGTGYDGPMEDLYHLSCTQILKRGANCLVYEGPGQATPRRQGHGLITDWWTVISPIVNYLHTRPDVDVNKIALLGDSFGGLLQPLAASREHRLSALILLDGLPSLTQVLNVQFGPELIGLFNQSKVTQFNRAVEQSLSQAAATRDGSLTGFRDIWAYSFWALDRSTPYEAYRRLRDFHWGLETAADIGDLPVYVAKGQDDSSTAFAPDLARDYLVNGRPNGANLTYYHEFPTSLGAGEHTSLGAESQVYISIMTWLSEIWGGYKFGDAE